MSIYLLSFIFIMRLALLVPAAFAATETQESTHSKDEQELLIHSLEDLFTLFSRANQFYSYRTQLTYEANGYITTYQLNHWIKDKTVYEQLLFLDGPPRKVLRRQNPHRCNLGDASTGVWSIPQVEANFSTYNLKAVGMERVAARQAIVFEIVPKDEFRYGYRYSVDKATGLILKAITYEKGKIIERLQAVSLEIVTPDTLNVEEGDTTYVWRVPEREPCRVEQFQAGWQVTWLPEGFKSVGTRLTAQSEQVLMFADAMASVSVFITNAPFDTLKKATARHGATVVVVSPIESASDRTVAVVGEVPTHTARKIAVSVEPL